MLRKTHNNGQAMVESTAQPDPSRRRNAADNFLAGIEQQAFRMALIAGLGVAVIRHATGVCLATFWAPELFRLAGFSSR